MKPQSAKAKGRTFQQQIRDLILKEFPQLEKDDVRSTSMGNGGEDIQLSPAARKVFPYQIECKSKARSATHTIYNQAKDHGKHEPLGIIKMNRDIPLAIISLSHLMELIKNNESNRSSSS